MMTIGECILWIRALPVRGDAAKMAEAGRKMAEAVTLPIIAAATAGAATAGMKKKGG